MKNIILILIAFCATLSFAQTQMIITKTTGVDSIPLSQIQRISFTTLSAFFVDDFSTDLNKWTVYAGDCGGTWNIINGELHANYSLSCGGTWNTQSQLILNDPFQPGDGNWRITVNFKKAIDPNYPNYTPIMASFSVWESQTKNIGLSIGMGGENLPANLDSVSIGYHAWDGSQLFNFQNIVVGRSWNSTIQHKASLEKLGNVYKLYLDDIYVGEFTDTHLTGNKKVGLHTYGPKIYDNFTIYK